MKLQTIRSRFHLLGVLIVLLSPLVSARAQSPSEPAVSQQPEAKQAAKSEGENREVKQLKSQVEKLQLLIEQQQRTLAEMQKRVDDLLRAELVFESLCEVRPRSRL